MQNLLLALLLAISSVFDISAQNQPRGRIRITNLPTTGNLQPIPLSDDINFPNGFKPQLPPQIPLQDWLVSPSAAPPTVPVPSVHHALPTQPEFKDALQPGPALETIVYGNWKPEHPQKPEEETLSSTAERERTAGRLEAMLMGLPVDSYDSVEGQQDWQSIDGTPNARHDNVADANDKKLGRRRIPTRGMQATQSTQQMPAVISVKASNPIMKEMAQQINESFESTTSTSNEQYPIRYISTTARTTDNTWIPFVPGGYETTTIAQRQASTTTTTTTTSTPWTNKFETISTTELNWPTDFLDPTTTLRPQIYAEEKLDDFGSKFSNEHESKFYEEQQTDNESKYENDQADIESKYYNENVALNSAQMHSDFSIAESLVPQLPLNITRVGVPYEELNSAEEPTICVPLTVSEISVTTEGEAKIEVERVYCFPLPQVEVKTIVNGSQPALNASQSNNEKSSNSTQTSSAALLLLEGYSLLVACCLWHFAARIVSL